MVRTINKCELEGVLIRDPELTWLPSGMPLMEFPLLVDDVRFDKESGSSQVVTMVFSVELWGNDAEAFAEEGRRKGERLYVLGKLVRRSVKKVDEVQDKIRVAAFFWQVTRRKPVAFDAGGPARNHPEAPF